MKIRTRDMILLIISLPMQAKKLAIENPKYKNTLNELLKYDFYADERGLPSIKDICSNIGTNRSTLKDHLSMMVEDLIWNLKNESNVELDIKEVIYRISIKGYNKWLSFSCKLPECPREGEYIEIPFVQYYFGNYLFYIDQVTHVLYNDKHIIKLKVHEGDYNRYYKMLRDEKEYGNYPEHYAKIYRF